MAALRRLRLRRARAAATTEAAPATTAAPAGPSAASVAALTELKRSLRAGQAQDDVLVEHTKFLETALAEDNVFNVRFHAEHLSNIVRGEPIRDLDGNGEASNPGDGVGLAGPNGGYVTGADRLYAVIADDAGLDAETRGRAERARASIAFMQDRLTAIVKQAERAAAVAGAADATDEVTRIRAAVDDVDTSYKGLRDGLADYDLSSAAAAAATTRACRRPRARRSTSPTRSRAGRAPPAAAARRARGRAAGRRRGWRAADGSRRPARSDARSP